jgi:hypothetical protein
MVGLAENLGQPGRHVAAERGERLFGHSDQIDDPARRRHQYRIGIDLSDHQVAQRDGQPPQGATIEAAVIPLQIIGRGAQGAGHTGTPARAEVGERRVAIAGAQTSTGRSACRMQ